LNLTNGRVIFLPDLHVPYHHKKAWGAALNLVADQSKKNTHTIHGGDFADNEAYSRHGKTFGRALDPEKHLKEVQKEAKCLDSATGGDKTILMGNHDGWIYKYIAGNAPMAENLLRPAEEIFGHGVIPVSYQEPFWVGRVAYLHDIGFAGANAAKQTLDAVQHCVVFGHTHRADITYSGTTEGERWFGMSCGWLGEASKITYMAPSKTRFWQLGLGIVDYHDGIALARFLPYVRGRFVLDGKVYR
jgi:predicted phosphodiesterase